MTWTDDPKALFVGVVLVLGIILGAVVLFETPVPLDDRENNTEFSDPSEDVVGWEKGVWYNQPLSIEDSDGLNESELELVTAQSMARVEILRDAEFTRDVTVDVRTRDEFGQQRSVSIGGSTNTTGYEDLVHQSMLLIEESSNGDQISQQVTRNTVLGYYLVGQDSLVIITDDPENLTIRGSTLVHELNHALQDQRFDLSREEFQPPQQNMKFAADLLIEGESMYVERLYTEKCRTGEWDCIEAIEPTQNPAVRTQPPVGIGIQLLNYYPYSVGVDYVVDLYSDGGWEAVDTAFESPPETTQAALQGQEKTPEFSELDDAPANWTTFEGRGLNGTDSLGPAGVYMLFWHQSYAYDINTISPRDIFSSEELGPYEYTSPLVDELRGDELIPFTNQQDDSGYVWRSVWSTEADATEFRLAYETILRNHGAENQGNGDWVIEDGGFADQYHISQSGDRVTIVNAESSDGIVSLKSMLP